jgi:hypothetical protein
MGISMVFNFEGNFKGNFKGNFEALLCFAFMARILGNIVMGLLNE